MPNHCANTLKITATNPDSLALLGELRQHLTLEDKKIFQIIRPCPEELMNTTASFSLDDTHNANIEKYGYAHWYDFCNTEWGTKWDAYEIDVLEDKEDTLTISFDTAWSPPMGIYETLHEMGFAVEATFVEQGCDFIGYWVDGREHTESLSALTGASEEEEEEYLEDIFDLPEYFAGHGITHAPHHFGG
jgi:hypothetical protein